ncbi:MAG TPA: glycosyltransferase family 4 protein, partial [Chloroflexota bacterium]|nr:glycosyltransferase family 4 protein [Chloroflexota bacterium]
VQDEAAVGVDQVRGVEVRRVLSRYPQRFRAYATVYNPPVVREIAREIAAFRPEIVHAHNIHTHISFRSLLEASKAGVPVVLTAHDHQLFCGTKFECASPERAASIPAMRCARCQRLRYFPLRNSLIRKAVARSVGRILAVSEALKEDLAANGYPGELIEALHNGIDPDSMAVEEGRVREFARTHGLEGKRVVLFGGRVSHAKGIDWAVEAMARLSPELNAVLMVLGSSDSYTAHVRALARGRGIEGRIAFLPWMTGDDLKAAYSASLLCLTPSVYREPFNLINIEAMALAKPVVTTRFGGPPEVVVDGETGYVVDPRDSEAMAARLSDLLSNEARAAAMGQAGYRRLLERFTVARQADRVEEVYRTLIEHRPPGTVGKGLVPFQTDEGDRATRGLKPAATNTDAGDRDTSGTSLDATPAHRSSLRILHLITSLDMGGAQKHLLAVVKGLRDRGHQADVAFFKNPTLADDFAATGAEVIDLHAPGTLDPTLLPRLARLLASGRYDILHTHLLKADSYGALAGALARTPVVLASKHNDEAALRNPLVGLVHGSLSRLDQRVVVLSDYVGRYVAERGRVDRARIQRVYYGLPPISPAGPEDGLRVRVELGIPLEAPLVLTVGRLTEQKGLTHLLEAMAIVLRRLPEARLLVVGDAQDGREEYKQSLLALHQSLGLGDRVIFTGVRPDVPALMRAADLFTMASLWEGFGLVFLEAMAAGKPVVATRVSAVPEVVADGVTGLLVPPADPPAMAEAMAALLSDPERARSMGEAGLVRLRDNFSEEKMVDSLEKLYYRLWRRQ